MTDRPTDHDVPREDTLDPVQLSAWAAFSAHLEETGRPLHEWATRHEREWAEAPRVPIHDPPPHPDSATPKGEDMKRRPRSRYTPQDRERWRPSLEGPYGELHEPEEPTDAAGVPYAQRLRTAWQVLHSWEGWVLIRVEPHEVELFHPERETTVTVEGPEAPKIANAILEVAEVGEPVLLDRERKANLIRALLVAKGEPPPVGYRWHRMDRTILGRVRRWVWFVMVEEYAAATGLPIERVSRLPDETVMAGLGNARVDEIIDQVVMEQFGLETT